MSEYAGSGATAVVNPSGANFVALPRKGRLVGLLIAPTGAVTPTITVYDHASAASGTAVVTVKVESGKPLPLWFGDEGINLQLGAFVGADAWTTLTVTAYVK